MGCASLISLSENPALFRARNISFYYIRKTFVFKGVFEIFILLHPDAIFINIILSADHLAREHRAVSSAVVPCAVGLYPLALDQRAGHSAVIPPVVVHYPLVLCHISGLVEIIPYVVDQLPVRHWVSLIRVAPPPAVAVAEPCAVCGAGGAGALPGSQSVSEGPISIDWI